MDLKRIFHKEGIKVLPVIQHCWTGREWHENVIAYLRVDFQCSVFSTYVYVRSAQNTWTRSLSYIEYTYASLENSPKTHFYTLKVKPHNFRQESVWIMGLALAGVDWRLYVLR